MTGSKKYNIIYADPPWRYEQRTVQGGAEQHYPTMTLDDICALPVAELADKDCALFLWTTFPKLKEAFRVIESWGFVYRTLAFLWLKQNRKDTRQKQSEQGVPESKEKRRFGRNRRNDSRGNVTVPKGTP